MLDLLYFSIKQLSRKRIRTLLTVLGISISISSIILINIISTNGKKAITDELASLGIDSVSVTAKNQPLSEEDIAVLKNISGVKNAAPLVVDIGSIDIAGENKSTLMWGIDSGGGSIMSIELLHGRIIDNADVSSVSNVCMIDASLCERLFGRENATGKKITVPMGGTSDQYEIIGIVSTGSGLLQNFIGDAVPSFIYFPYTTLLSASGKSDFTQAAIKLDEGIDADRTCEQISKRLSLINNNADSYTVENYVRQKERLDNLLGIITIVLSAIAAISLLVAGLEIMTTMIVSVNERMKEIGIKKSIGASKGTILKEFLFEAALMCFFGSIIGAIIGILAAKAGGAIFGIKLSVDPVTVLLCIVICVVVGSLFGVYPALKAANLKPVESLRHE